METTKNSQINLNAKRVIHGQACGLTRYGSDGSAREHQINLYILLIYVSSAHIQSTHIYVAIRTRFFPSTLFLFLVLFFRRFLLSKFIRLSHRSGVGNGVPVLFFFSCFLSLARPFNIPNKNLRRKIEISMTHINIACLTDDFIRKIILVFFDWINNAP